MPRATAALQSTWGIGGSKLHAKRVAPDHLHTTGALARIFDAGKIKEIYRNRGKSA